MRYKYIKDLKFFSLLFLILFLTTFCNREQKNSSETLTDDTLTDDEISLMIEKGSPLNGAKIPENIKFRLGAAHVAGKYYLTDEPYLIEGCKAIQNLGFGIVKLWFQRTSSASDYPFNSKWNLIDNPTLVEMAMHPYFKTVFDMDFKTFVLSVRSEINFGRAMNQFATDYAQEENAMYLLAKYLFETYRERNIVFILENWEGDWLMRGGTGSDAQWTSNSYPADVGKRAQVMIHWFKARQAGVERARNEAGNTKCKIYHAIEVNKVLDCKKGIPGLTLNVLPFVKTDMVSWSCYDGLSNPVDLWHGIDYIIGKMKPTKVFPGTPVMIGEIGIPENRGSVFGIPEQDGKVIKDELVKRWDRAMSVFLEKDIPYIIQWEVYCNEAKDGVKDTLTRTADQVGGFWLIRPDGTESYCASYLKRLVQNPGRTINN